LTASKRLFNTSSRSNADPILALTEYLRKVEDITPGTPLNMLKVRLVQSIKFSCVIGHFLILNSLTRLTHFHCNIGSNMPIPCFDTDKLARMIALHPDIDSTTGKMSAPSYILRNRRNKVAKGMTKTCYRSCQCLSQVANQLSVKGTTDRLGASWLFIKKDPVTKKYRLTNHGKERLNLKRLRKNATI